MDAMGIGLGALDYMIQDERNHRAFGQQNKLLTRQKNNQMELNEQGKNLQLEMWRKTNYKQQIAMMEKAGLNPALMYKSAGQGGSLGSQTGGSAVGGNAPQQPKMDITTILNAKLIKAQAEKIEAETKAIEGYQKEESLGRLGKTQAERENVIQKTLNLRTDNEVRKVEKGLLELKESKQVTGSTIVDLMTQVGLDPVNNESDRDKVKALLGLYFGSKVVKDIMQGLGGLKGRTINNNSY